MKNTDNGLTMFEVDTDYNVPPTEHTVFMCQTIPAKNISEAINITITNLSREQTRKVNVKRVQVTTARK